MASTKPAPRLTTSKLVNRGTRPSSRAARAAFDTPTSTANIATSASVPVIDVPRLDARPDARPFVATAAEVAGPTPRLIASEGRAPIRPAEKLQTKANPRPTTPITAPTTITTRIADAARTLLAGHPRPTTPKTPVLPAGAQARTTTARPIRITDPTVPTAVRPRSTSFCP